MIEVLGKSVCGPARSNNEDFYDYRFVGDVLVMAVADGLGGCPYGEIASRIAVTSVIDSISEGLATVESDADMKFMLKRAFNVANVDILRDQVTDPDHSGMCSTLTVAVIQDGHLTVAHYGDCRCYVISGSDINLITEDHNVANHLIKELGMSPEDARVQAGKSQLVCCLGENKFIKPDIYGYDIIDDDCVVLASDGMYTLFDEDTCLEILRRRNDLGDLCDYLVARGASDDSIDNSTVVISKIIPDKTGDTL